MESPRKRLLIIDDEVGLTKLMKMNLERFGNYLVEIVNESPLACAAARTYRPDLILLDMEMPDMKGEEVLRSLKSDPALKTVPVLVFSAFDDRGGDTVPKVSKPVSLSSLISAINSNIVA